jgi:O-antigen ligase
MTVSASSVRIAQQRVVFATLVLSSCILWIGAFNSGVAKQPVFVLGMALVFSLAVIEWILAQQVTLTLSRPELVAALFIPLFFVSASLRYDVVYTRDALCFAISFLICFFAGAKLFQANHEREWLLRNVVILTAFLCMIGAIQYLFGPVLPLDFFIGPDKRVASLLGNSNFFSAYLILALPLALAAAIRERSQKTKRWRHSVLVGVIVMLLLATQARSSALAAAVVFAVFFAFSRQSQTRRIAIIAAAFLAGSLIVLTLLDPAMGKRFVTMFDLEGSFGRRTYIWSGAMHAFFASPIVGHGIGRFESALFERRSPDYWQTKSEDIVAHAHNEILEIAVEYGIIGILMAAAFLFFVLQHGIRVARADKRTASLTAIALVSSIVGIAVDNLGNVSLRQAPITLFAWLLLGILSSMDREEQRTRSYTLAFKLPSVVAVLPLVACAAFAWWYGSAQLKVFESSVHVLKGIVFPEERTSDRIRHFAAATNADSLNLLAHSLLAREYMKEQRWSEELHQLECLNSLSPFYPKSHLMKAYALNRMDRNVEALQAIDAESRLRSHPETFEIRSFAYRGLKDTTNERRALLQTIEQSIKGGVVGQIPYASRRLKQLNRNMRESQETRTAFATMHAAFSTNIELRNHLQRIQSDDQ